MNAREIIEGLYKIVVSLGVGQQGELPAVIEEAEAFLKGSHMTFDEYQQQSATTAIYDKKLKVLYPALGLGGEAGEVLEKVKKCYRDLDGKLTPQVTQQIALELGDVLWYVAALARDLGISLDSIAELNVNKLTRRRLADKLKGSGDNR